MIKSFFAQLNINKPNLGSQLFVPVIIPPASVSKPKILVAQWYCLGELICRLPKLLHTHEKRFTVLFRFYQRFVLRNTGQEYAKKKTGRKQSGNCRKRTHSSRPSTHLPNICALIN